VKYICYIWANLKLSQFSIPQLSPDVNTLVSQHAECEKKMEKRGEEFGVNIDMESGFLMEFENQNGIPKK
jgi:hypothetical protein